MQKERHKQYVHHGNPGLMSTVREVVFGLEDGMVSTLGVITGIAVGTNNYFVVILSGFVVVAVEALSMSAGSYLSSKSVREIEERKLNEERYELKHYPKDEERELEELYKKEGVDAKTAQKLASIVSKHQQLLFKEMACHELNIIPERREDPGRNALFMGLSYVVGGMIPVLPYFFTGIRSALVYSIIATVVALFLLGALRTRYTAQSWLKSGFELMSISISAALIGYLVAKFVEMAFNVQV